MAYTCVKVIFEIGHDAVVRPKKSSKGMTHDWELFIRGAENTDIHHFVDRVVFHLHETFENPKRVVKEPPYSIRESGYAGFDVIVDVHLKSKPPTESKVSFSYALVLQSINDGPISRLVKEKYVFSNPTEDFRRKLIRGGGVGVGAESSTTHSSHLSSVTDDLKTFKNKSFPIDSSSKKLKKGSSPKHEEQPSQNEFSMLFGTPIIKNKIPNIMNSKPSSKVSDKIIPDKVLPSSKTLKHSSVFKDKEKDKDRSDKEKKEREKDRDKGSLKKGENLKKEKKDEKILKTSKEEIMKNSYHDEKKSVEKLGKDLKAEKQVKDRRYKEEKKLKSKEKHKVSDIKKGNLTSEDREKSAAKEIANAIKDEKKLHKLEDTASKKDAKNIYSNGNVNIINPVLVNTFNNQKKEDKHKRHKHRKEKLKDQKHNRNNKIEKMELKSEQSKSTSKGESPKRPKKPLKKLFEELTDNSNLSSSEDEVKMPKKDSHDSASSSEFQKTKDNQLAKRIDSKNKNKKLSDENESKKRKRKSKHKNEENEAVKIGKYGNDTLTNDSLQRNTSLKIQESETNSMVIETRFTDEYISKLKELQRKIMGLEDHSGLQRIVQVIAETGQYEITTKTFDFDLCTLDEAIVQRLIDFFVS